MLTIKRLTEAELDQVAAIEKEVFSMPWSKQGFLEAIAMDNVCFLLAMEEDTVLGYCGLYMAFDEGEITNVAVGPNYRRRGIADQMIARLLEFGEKQNMEQFFLEVRVSNEAAIRLYEKHGFQRQGIRKDFYQKPTEDAFIMSRNRERR